MLAGRLRPAREASTPWSTEVPDERLGRVRLTGRWRAAERPRGVALLIHGLGGSADSHYLPPFQATLAGRGWSSLRVNLRGADRQGGGLHHAGFVDDLPRILAAPPLSAAPRVAVIGFSLGGHLTLRFAALTREPRLSAAVAICSPADLEAGATAIDRPAAWPYRRYLLSSIQEVYEALAGRLELPTPVERARRARTLREWDGLVVAPWFGFASAEDYYAQMSVAPRLGEIETPTWIIAGERDPMVPARTLRRALVGASPSTEITWVRRGGHVGFPRDLDLGRRGPLGLANQVATWLDER